MNSDMIKEGFERAPHRSLLYATGVKKDDLRKPFIGVCNSFVEIIPGHVHLNKVAEFIKQEMLDLIPVEYREVVRGHALVKQLFSLSHVGVAAGSLVTDGVMTMEGKARVLRNKKVVHTGAFSSIRHFKDEVKQVTQAQECGILLAGFESFQEGDVIECFSFEELPKAL